MVNNLTYENPRKLVVEKVLNVGLIEVSQFVKDVQYHAKLL